MNWVGGSRNRLAMKDDAKKQRDFFEKRRMQKKLKNLGLSLPTSAGGSSPGSASMDLVTLFIVNQIATKKESNDNPKVPVFGGSSRKGSSHQNKPLVLPMSPCSPSQLSLVDSPYSSQRMRRGRTIIPPGFKCHQLSPVMESGFSDNSASDYVQPKADTLSPFSSTSLSPSGLGGVFSLQLNHQQTQLLPPPSPPPPPFWDTAAPERTNVHPCSQSTGTAEGMPWLFGSNPPLQLETPTAAQVLFGSPHIHMNDVGDHPRSQACFSLTQLEETDFTLNQSETEQQFEDKVFSGFSDEFGEKDEFHYSSVNSKIFLKDETPAHSSASQSVSASQSMDVKLYDCGDNNFSCPGNMTSLENSCESSPKSCCCRGREDSSDLNDVDLSYVEQACYADARSQVSPHREKDTPSTDSVSGRGTGDGVTEKTVCSTFASPSTVVHNLNTELCGCNKSQVKTHDAETQTVNVLTAETRDASTQCTDSEDRMSIVPLVNLPPVDRPLLVKKSSTGGQSLTAAHSNVHAALTASRGQYTPSSNPVANFLQVNSQLSSNRRDDNMFLQTVLQHVPGALSETGGGVKSD